jgi:hypothetical protein
MAEIKFVKIVVKIGDAELSLSLEEVRALRDELNKVINDPVFVPPVSVPIVYPLVRPWYEEPYKITWWHTKATGDTNA